MPAPTLAASRNFPLILIGGALVNGAAAAMAMWIASSQLGLDGFAPLAQLWTIWGLVATGLVFGFHQWEIGRNRSLSDGAPANAIPRQVPVVVVVSSAVLGLCAFVWRIELFGVADWEWWAASASLPAGTAVTGLSYAVLARRRRLFALAMFMSGENLVRLCVTALLIVGGARPQWFALTVPAGFVVAMVPALLERRVARGSMHDGQNIDVGGVGAMATVGLSSNLVLFGAPLILGLAGGRPSEVSALFLLLLPLRVPFLLAQSLLPAFGVHSNELAVRGDLQRIRHISRRASVLGVSAALPLAAAGLLVGDPLGKLVFGIGGQLDGRVYAGYGAAMAIGLALQTTNVLMIATSQLRWLGAGWACAITLGAVLTSLGLVSDPSAVALWTLGTSLAMLAAHRVMLARATSQQFA